MTLVYDFKGFIFDLDGVIWRGDEVVSGADRVIQRLKELDRRILFLTNNASKSREDYVRKLARLGINADAEDVVTSGYVTAEHIKRKYGPSRLYVVGMDGFKRELSSAGHCLVYDKPDFVVVGMDENFTYKKLLKAFRFVHYEGARLVAANDDAVTARDGFLAPVAGSILASVEFATNVKAEVVGKPNKPMISFVSSRLELPGKEVLMVGDNIETDIAFGFKAGFKTALVLSGVSTKKDLTALRIKPDYVLKDVAEIIE